MKILCVLGTRPEAIKMAPVIRQLRRQSVPRGLQTLVCVTAQHREMLDQVLALFNIQPDYDLDLMRDNQTLSELTAKVLLGVDQILTQEQPDWVLVQGDTTTAMAAALAAFYRQIKIGHVEAGLRTWHKFHPFPEEINRKITDDVADLHFAPTQTARQNLRREGIDDTIIFVTGNPVIDALHWVAAQPFDWERSLLAPVVRAAANRRLILVTAHRRENFGVPLENICAALLEIAERYRRTVHIVYPVHLNPNVQAPVSRLLRDVPNITLVPPLDYLPLVHLMKRAYLVLTDSGGIQEEAPGLGKPVLVLREVTERPEAVEAGTVKIVGTDRECIVAETVQLLEDSAEYARMAHAVNPYGDGHAAERIVDALVSFAQR